MKKHLFVLAAFVGSLLAVPTSYAQYVTESIGDSTIVVQPEPELYTATAKSKRKTKKDNSHE